MRPNLKRLLRTILSKNKSTKKGKTMMIDFTNIQNKIGYKFKNADLLQQAFIRKSYSEENGGQNNEVLEFIGDKALDLAVIRKMMERFGYFTEAGALTEIKSRYPKYFQTKFKEGKFTEIKKDLVEKKALAGYMNDLGFHSQLIMGHGDIQGNVQEQDSVKEDLFEAIIGAVALDSNWNLNTITAVVERMIDFDSYFENCITKDENYVGRFQTWYQRNVNPSGTPDYQYSGTSGDFCCTLTFVWDDRSFRAQGNGTSQAKARMECAKDAYGLLEKNGCILNPFKEAAKEADYSRAKAQINELVQKKMIPAPHYSDDKKYAPDGTTIWTVTIRIEGIDKSFTNSDKSKKEAENKCAYDMLLYLMGEHEE